MEVDLERYENQLDRWPADLLAGEARRLRRAEANWKAVHDRWNIGGRYVILAGNMLSMVEWYLRRARARGDTGGRE